MSQLFRGFNKRLAPGLHANPFLITPRTPKHTPRAIHDFADSWFLKNFAVAARSRSIICTTDCHQANLYAAANTVFIIQPLSPYSLIYSPLVRDFLDIICELTVISEITVDAWLAEKGYVAVNHTDAIDRDFRGEVLVICQTFIVERICIQ